MARLSRATRETIKTILVILIVVIVILVYLVYPLNRTSAFMGRAASGDKDSTSLTVPNEIGPFAGLGVGVDTFRVESDGLTNLAALYVAPSLDPPKGLAILVPSEQKSRDMMQGLTQAFLDSGLAVVTYDQRATARSTGAYRSDGQQEANDLQAMIAYLEIHGKIVHPLVVVGNDAGGDAALITGIEERRIDALAAIEPYLTTDRMIDALREKKSLIWFPFYRTMFWWWYNIRSGYAATYRTANDLNAPSVPTVIVDPANDPAVQALTQRAKEPLTVLTVTPEEHDLVGQLLALARK